MASDITKEEIVELNRKIVELFGGHTGLQNEANLDFALLKAENAKDIYRKAAELMYWINKGHPFLDGNKRTAFEAARIFLLANDIKLKFGENDAEDFMVKMAQPETLSVKEVEIWIREHGGQDAE